MQVCNQTSHISSAPRPRGANGSGTGGHMRTPASRHEGLGGGAVLDSLGLCEVYTMSMLYLCSLQRE